MTGPEQHRRFARRPILVEFRVRDADDVAGGEIVFDAVDLSEGGAFLRSEILLERGDRIEISFTLPNPAITIHARARVAWVTHRDDAKGEPGMGLEFLDLRDDERRAITAWRDG